MPFIELKTNIEIKKELINSIKSKLGSSITLLSKSEDWLMINISDKQTMFFKGSSDNCLILEVKCYGNISSKDSSKFSKEMTDYLSKTLSIDPSRIYINYFSTSLWGYSGFNF